MNFKRVLEIIYTGVFTFLAILSGQCKGGEAVEANVPIRVGWQIPAVTQAAIVQVLKRTDVLARHGLEPSLVPFSFGTPEVEAALAGKTVASPFGSIAHREAFLEQQAAGLDAAKDVKNENMDILEIRRRVLAGGVETWEEMDAAAVWEPDLSSFQLAELTRNLSETRALGVVAISDEFISKHPEATTQFLVALVRAWGFFPAIQIELCGGTTTRHSSTISLNLSLQL